jgi:hypothetical protein
LISLDAGEFLLPRWVEFCETMSISSDMMFPVFRYAAQNVVGAIDVLKEVKKSGATPDIRDSALRSLGCAPLDSFKELLQEFSCGNCQDITPFLFGTSYSYVNSRYTWEYLKENFATIIAKFGTVAFILPGMLSTACCTFCKVEEAEEVEKFAKEHECEILERAFTIQVGEIRAKAAILERGAASVHAALAGK